MKSLEQKIIKEGIVKEGNVLKVDNFLNHQIDVAFLDEMGKEFKQKFINHKITKILTIEASGIGVAVMVARHFNNVPVVFAKKSKTSNISSSLYHTRVDSYTHQKTNDVVVSKQYLNKEDHILIIDDFLANGCAILGLIDLVKQADAIIEGVGIVIEKGYQTGGQTIRELGYHLESLAIIESMNDQTGEIIFRSE
ncbi:MAG: xanthine phosphoribosyltransferase [Coprobacillus sp.]